MKSYNNVVPKLFKMVLIFILLVVAESLRPYHYIPETYNGKGSRDGDEGQLYAKQKLGAKKEVVGMELYPTGSSLPDCSRACGACFPCRRVMVSFECSTESCPIVYRCMCRGRYYHVPSN